MFEVPALVCHYAASSQFSHSLELFIQQALSTTEPAIRFHKVSDEDSEEEEYDNDYDIKFLTENETRGFDKSFERLSRYPFRRARTESDTTAAALQIVDAFLEQLGHGFWDKKEPDLLAAWDAFREKATRHAKSCRAKRHDGLPGPFLIEILAPIWPLIGGPEARQAST